MPKIRVRPTAAHPHVPYVDESDRTWMGRFVGLNADGSAMPNGEEVEASVYYQRKINLGALEIVPDLIADPAQQEVPASGSTSTPEPAAPAEKQE